MMSPVPERTRVWIDSTDIRCCGAPFALGSHVVWDAGQLTETIIFG